MRVDSTQKNYFYDLEDIKNIPIEEVCRCLGLPLVRKGPRFWTKIRNEKTSSVLLNRFEDTTDSKYINSFHDFGDGKHGNVIDLVSITQNLDFAESVKFLGEMFNIAPINDRDGLEHQELSNREYAFIGIEGDMVAKNLNLPIDISDEELFKIADRYSMTVNDFRKSNNEEDKKLYASIIKNTSIYQLQKMRTSYYMNIWNTYTFLKGAFPIQQNSNDNQEKDTELLKMFETLCSEKHYEKLREDIEKTEKYINKAIEGTNLTKIRTRSYAPKNVIESLLNSYLKPQIGPYDYKEIQKLSEDLGSELKHRPVDYNKYIETKEALKAIPYSARLDAGTVVIGYLKKDVELINELFGPPIIPNKDKGKSFNSIVKDAERRKANTIKPQSRENIEK